MHCGRVSNLLSAYIDRELAGSEMLLIRRHLDSCAGCAAELETLGRVKSILSLAPPSEPPEDPTAAVMQRWALRQSQPAPPPPRWQWDWRWKRPTESRRWQRYSLAFTCASLALALAGTALALRKPNYPDAVAANVLPSLLQMDERLPVVSPRYEMWPPERVQRRTDAPYHRPDVWWNGAGPVVNGMLISETLPHGAGR